MTTVAPREIVDLVDRACRVEGCEASIAAAVAADVARCELDHAGGVRTFLDRCSEPAGPSTFVCVHGPSDDAAARENDRRAFALGQHVDDLDWAELESRAAGFLLAESVIDGSSKELGNPMSTWSVRAVNLPDHASNPIHTDEGGRAAGFAGALVAGVTTYAYLTHVPAASSVPGWGLDWIGGGGAELRLLAPVLDQDPVDCVPIGEDGDRAVEARVAGEVRATARVWSAGTGRTNGASGSGGDDGERLGPLDVLLDESWQDYGERAGDDLTLYRREGIVHPAAWPRLANDVFHAQLVTGSWIHTRSRIQHLGLGGVGGTARVETTVVERFTTRSGERAIADVRIAVDGLPTARIEHEALISLAR